MFARYLSEKCHCFSQACVAPFSKNTQSGRVSPTRQDSWCDNNSSLTHSVSQTHNSTQQLQTVPTLHRQLQTRWRTFSAPLHAWRKVGESLYLQPETSPSRRRKQRAERKQREKRRLEETTFYDLITYNVTTANTTETVQTQLWVFHYFNLHSFSTNLIESNFFFQIYFIYFYYFVFHSILYILKNTLTNK